MARNEVQFQNGIGMIEFNRLSGSHPPARAHAAYSSDNIDPGKLVGEIEPPKRDLQKEAQRRDLRVHLRRLRALLGLVHLEPAQVLSRRRVGRAAEKPFER